MYQISSGSEFCRKCYKNILVSLFSAHTVYIRSTV